MKRFKVIAGKDIREAISSRSTYLYIALLFFLTFTYFSLLTGLINQAIENHLSQIEILQMCQVFLNNMASSLPMMFSVLMCTIFAAYSVIVDKAKHNLDSLMVTPISMKQIWMAKTLGVTIPSVGIALGVTIVGYLVMNFILVMPQTHSFVFPGWSILLTDLVIVPILIYFIVALVIYFQLVIYNPRVANLVFTGLFLLLFFSSNIITQKAITIDYNLIYLGLIVLCGGLTYIFSFFLTKEKVILSSKG
jgi:hypothetical protein